MSLLALISARGGSKGILRKNIRELCGKPLIAWSIEAAQNSVSVDKIVVSTEDEEIADIARFFGADVPFLRPKELAQDDTPGIAPVLHALEKLPGFDQILQMHANSPLRTADDIDEIVNKCQEQQTPAAISICESPRHPNWMWNCDEDGKLSPFTDSPRATRRQDLPKIYTVNGALYLGKSEWIQQTCDFISSETLGYVMPPERSKDIDTLLDWEWVEFLMKKRK